MATFSKPRNTLQRCNSSGFTLLEIMVTVSLIALLILPIMVVRDASENQAFRSTHMMEAMRLGHLLLADRLTDPDPAVSLTGDFAQYGADPDAYTWLLTVEEFDLSTKREVDPDDDPFGEVPFPPADAALPNTDLENEPYRVRRVGLTVFFPGIHDDESEETLIEQYPPIVAQYSAPNSGNL